MKVNSMYLIPAAAAMTAALIFSVPARAQTQGTTTTTTPPGSTNPRDSAMPAPQGMGGAARSGMESSGSGNPVTNSATQTPGTTKPTDNINPAPTAGKGNSGRANAGQSMSGNPVTNSATQTPGTTRPQDNVVPAPTAGNSGMGMTQKRDANKARKQNADNSQMPKEDMGGMKSDKSQ